MPGFGDNRGGHRQVLTVNETHVFSQALVNEVRGGYNRISISFDPSLKVDTNALGINLGQTTMPVALPQITISGPGLNFGGPAAFPSGREVTTTCVRRHGDLPARQSHHQVRRRVPSRQAVQQQRRPRQLHVSERGGVPAGIRQRADAHARRPVVQRLRERVRRVRAGLDHRSDRT